MLKQSNTFIESFIELSRVQRKLLLLAVNDISCYDNSTQLQQVFKVKNLKNSLNLEKGKEYKIIKEAVELLSSKTILIKSSLKTFNVFDVCNYVKKRGEFIISFSKDMIDVLNNFKKGFTLLDLKYLLNLKSLYSVRFYEILKQYEKLKERKIDVTDLKFLLGINDKYDRYHNFKQRVIEPALRDINRSTDIYIDYTENKVGKKTTSISFCISKQKNECLDLLIPRSSNVIQNAKENENTESGELDKCEIDNSLTGPTDKINEIVRMFPTYVMLTDAKKITRKLLKKYSEGEIIQNVKYATKYVKIPTRYEFYLNQALLNKWGKNEVDYELYTPEEKNILDKYFKE